MSYICQYCGRILKYPVAHKCRDGFRKRKLKFETIMTKEETKQAAEIMLAFAEGKKIQVKNKDENKWFDFTKYTNPTWNFDDFDYRIAPERKYRPFKNADEAFQEAKKHGFWVKDETGNYRLICYIYDKGAEIANEMLNSYTYDDILSFVWADDGSKCGILEE